MAQPTNQAQVDNYYHYVYEGIKKRLYASPEQSQIWKKKYEFNWQAFMIASHEQTSHEQIQYVGVRSF